jgi:hypothetical protein
MRHLGLAVAAVLGICGSARAQTNVSLSVSSGLLCRSAVAAAERGNGIPAHLLAAISRVESGRRDPATGAVHPWPWTANAEGQGYYFETKAEAVATVRAMQARGIRSIDIGCGQINLMYHPTAFASLEQAFDPQSNADYAAKFLKNLFAQTGDWNKAAAYYHSATPELGAEYQQKVLAVWPEEQRLAGLVAPSPPIQGSSGTTAPTMPASFMRIVHLQPPGMPSGPRMIMLPTVGGAAPPGRGLDAYRATPIGLAYQAPPRRIGG